MTSTSTWWPTPADASAWFDESERREAAAYHGPIERAVLIRTAIQAAAVLGVLGFASVDDGDSVIVVAAMLAVAIGLPRAVADGWRELHHEPRFGGGQVSLPVFVVTAAGRSMLDVIGLTAAAWLLEWRDFEVVELGALAVICLAVPLVLMRVGPYVVLASHRVRDLTADHPAVDRATALAAAFGAAAPRLVRLDTASFAGANAYVTTQRHRTVIAVSQQLLDEPPALFDHVVAHELTHFERRHLRWSTVAASASLAIAVVTAVVVAQQWATGPARLAVGLAVGAATSLPLRWCQAWLSRAHERQADRRALELAPVTASQLRSLHLTDRALLEPSRWSRLHSLHPSPPERLEVARRHVAGR